MSRTRTRIRVDEGDRLKRRAFLVAGAAAVAVRSRMLRAQQTTVPVIGFLHFGSAGQFSGRVEDFRQGLAQSGYVEGQTVAVEYRWAEGRYDRLPALAADLVGHKVDVIVAAGGIPAALAARNATSTIPIVFTAVADPWGPVWSAVSSGPAATSRAPASW